jgi:hypothetical protein
VTTAATAADPPATIDDDVSDLTCTAAGAGLEFAASHNSAADTGANEAEDDVGEATTGAKGHLAGSGHLDVTAMSLQ